MSLVSDDDYPVDEHGEFLDCRVKSCNAAARRYLMTGPRTGVKIERRFCDFHAAAAL